MKHSTRAAAVIELPNKYSKVLGLFLDLRYPAETVSTVIDPQVNPKGDLVLCKVAEAEEQNTGGLLLPTSAQTKPTSGFCFNQTVFPSHTSDAQCSWTQEDYCFCLR